MEHGIPNNCVNAEILTVLSRFKGRRITVELKEPPKIVGKLVDFDWKMNLLLEDAEECYGDDPVTRYGIVLVRGNMIRHIHLPNGF